MNNLKNNYLEENSDFEDDYESEKDDYEDDYHRQRINSGSDGANIDSDGDYRRELSELELRRKENIKKRDEFLQMLMQDPEYADVVVSANELKRSNKIIKPKKDPSFQYKGTFRHSLEIRRSSRLQNIPPVFFKEDLIDEVEINRKRKRSEECDYYDLETVIYQPKISRVSSHNTVRSEIVPIESITDDMLANIARKGTIKTYSDTGTSCHQCRQKTKDQKTYCRSLSCVGVRGQFCGVCLENRYGEDVAVALKDPTWKCPVCRGICNCSFCRHKAGKRPTGILAPLAQQSGHKSVKDFLESLKGEGDYVHEDYLWQKMNSPKYFLGYSKDLKFAHMGRNVRHEINNFLTWEGLKNWIWKKENELESIMDLHDEPRCLLGFFEGTDRALLSDGTHCFMGPVYLRHEQLIQKLMVDLDIIEKEYANKLWDVSGRKHLDKQDEISKPEKCCVASEESNKFIPKENNDATKTAINDDYSEKLNHTNKNQINPSVDLNNSNKFVEKKGQELELIGCHEDKSNSLGFFEGTNKALIDDGTWCYSDPVSLEQDQKINNKYTVQRERE